MRVPILASLLAAACASGPPETGGGEPPPRREAAGPDGDLFETRDADTVEDRRPVPKPSAGEIEDFKRVWELYRKRDPRWPVERDRFKARGEAAAYLVAGHLLRHYMQVNAVRARAKPQLDRVIDEIVGAGAPCAPYLVNVVVLDRIPLGEGRFFVPDDITRRDCVTMLQRMGPQAVPELMRALRRDSIGVKGRRLTAKALGGTRDPRAFETLVRLLETDEAWQVRADAAEALGLLGDRRALAPLRKAMKSDADPAVVKRAAKARHAILHGR